VIVPAVYCPDCGAVIELPSSVRPGDLVDCPNCAGHALRVREERGHWSATLAYQVSCPDCDEVLTLPENARAGDTVSCCGRTYRLTVEFGAFAAEKM
jgi:Zn finger protein HypA/HybF involved in hydrogenase expression